MSRSRGGGGSWGGSGRSSKGTRAQQRDRAATAAEEPPKTVRAQNPRMRREDRLRKKQKLQERQDESVMEWDAFLKRTKNGKDKDTLGQQKRTRPARSGPSTNGDKVVTHRSIATFEGQKRVPVFQDKGGTLFLLLPQHTSDMLSQWLFVRCLPSCRQVLVPTTARARLRAVLQAARGWRAIAHATAVETAPAVGGFGIPQAATGIVTDPLFQGRLPETLPEDRA
eukprot:s1498_g9.t1